MEVTVLKITFVTNNYLTIWNLLFGPSISEKTHKFKMKLWETYRKEYKAIENDKDEILKDMKNFIPDDNTLYDLLEDTQIFEKLETDTEKHRVKLIKMWDFNKKNIIKEFNDILRVDFDRANVIVLHPSINTSLNCDGVKNIAWGMRDDTQDELLTILKILESIFQYNKNYEKDIDRLIYETVIHMAIVNEIYTRINKSNYLSNVINPGLTKEIYPYFLMYMGLDIDEVSGLMMRDNIPFDISKYNNNPGLRTLDIFEFIDYIIDNKEVIFKKIN